MKSQEKQVIELKPFCETNTDVSEIRQFTLTPFSIGDWSYATDGRLMVRVPRREDVPENPAASKKAEELFSEAAPTNFSEPPTIEFPKADEEECGECDGRGSAHDCPTCNCPCVACVGTGWQQPWHDLSIGYGEAVFNARYIARIKDLPGLKFGKPDKEKPMRFLFDGGEGLIMPMRGRWGSHIDLDEAKAA